MITVAFTVSGQRPAYLKQTLEAWHRVRGVQDAHLLLSCDPGLDREEFSGWVERSFAHSTLCFNPERLGCFANTKQVLDLATITSPSDLDFVVLAEEDVLPSDDVLEYFSWAAVRYAGEHSLAAVCAHSYKQFHGSWDDHAVTRVPWFSPILWGSWVSQLQDFILPQWGGIPANPDAWDAGLRLRIAGANKRSLFPVRSRALHIGELSTLIPTVALSEHFYKQSVSSTYQPHYDPGTYRAVAMAAGSLQV